MGARRDHPLAGIEQVPWAELLGADAAPFLAAMARLAAHGGSADAVAGLLDDEDFSYPPGIGDEGFGYRDAAVPALGFLARIIAQPGGLDRADTIELIDLIAHGEVWRAGRSGAEMDARVDALRAALVGRVRLGGGGAPGRGHRRGGPAGWRGRAPVAWRGAVVPADRVAAAGRAR